MKKHQSYPVLIIWSEDDDAFLARVLDLPGCVADGATQEEALKNAHHAVELWIETAKSLGREIPEPWTVDQVEKWNEQLDEQQRRQFRKAVDEAVAEAVKGVMEQILPKFLAQFEQPSKQQFPGMHSRGFRIEACEV